MKKTPIIIVIILFISILNLIPSVYAEEKSYGTLNAFFSKDQKNWEEATVTNITLKRGETFYIKTEVITKIKLLAVNIEIWETGETDAENSTYTQLSGPSVFYNGYHRIDVDLNENITFIYKFQVKPDAEWVNSYAPLNVRVQYNTDHTDSQIEYFTIINPYIEDKLCKNYNPFEKNYEDLNQSNNLKEENTSLDKNNENNFENEYTIPQNQIISFFFLISITVIFYIKTKEQDD